MKTKPSLIQLAILVVFSIGVLGAAFNQSRIRWTWHDMTLYGGTFYNGTNLASSVEFGLRDDGVVVWREITTATNVIVTTTNSPAERDDSGVMILTNSIPYHDTKWTNGAWFQFLPMADITNGVYFP